MWRELIPDAIPAVLRAQPWVLSRAEPRAGKPQKVPYRISDPTRRASSTDPETWGTFGEAVDAYALLTGPHRDPNPVIGPLIGIGAVLTAEAQITCFDLDGVLDGAQLLPGAARLVAHVQSWTEISVSGTGLHLFVHGTLPHPITHPEAHLELYDRAKVMVVTGHTWAGTPSAVQPRQAILDQVVRLLTPPPGRSSYAGPSRPPPDDLGGTLLAKAQAWGLRTVGPLKRWADGYLLELARCPWADVHTTGPGGAAILIRASGAFDFVCHHGHCRGRDWRDLRAARESVR